MPNQETYTEREWLLLRVFTLLIWWPLALVVLFRFDGQPFPEAICKIINCALITYGPIKWIVVGIMLAASYGYLRQRYMLGVTGVFAVCSIILFSLERSNGLTYRDEILTMVWIAQFMAYLFQRFPAIPERLRLGNAPVGGRAIRYSVQMVAAAFVVSAIYKLRIAGVYWIWDSPNIALQVIKTHNDFAHTFGNEAHIAKGRAMADFVLQNPYIFRFLFFCGLSLELGSFVAVFHKKAALVVGCFFILFFISTAVLVNIIIPTFFWFVLIYFINLPYRISLLFKKDSSPILS